MNYKILFITMCFVFSLFLGSFTTTVDAVDIDIAQQYAPILYFEKDETCFPVDVSYHIDNSYLFQVGITEPISYSPSESELSSYSADEYQYCYLDNQKGTVNDNGIINDYQSQENILGYTVYYRVYTESGATIVQYWMFYAFNKGELNQHEGDWEMVQVVIPSGDSKWVAYSQHHGGQKATWGQVERDGDHIKVYVARGSHANYLRSYSGKLGVANDIVGSNGKILKPGEYTLESLEEQGWLDFRGRWGECGDDISDVVGATFLGKIGPEGPMYREGGAMWENAVSWGNNLLQANDNLFLLEWFLYNFVLIFILITAASLCITGFLIYRRHKKYGLGPRIISMFYINGLNLKSIGNILCVVGIVIAIFGLFNTWYGVSYDLSGVDVLQDFEIPSTADLMKVDGINGVQIIIPGQNGPTPLGTVSLPFSLLIGIGLLFMIIATIGISHSKKLGWKYIWRGIRLLIPIILLIVVILAISSIIPSDAIAGSEAGGSIGEILSSISSSPLGNQKTFLLSIEEVSISLQMRWGLGLGAQLLLISGIIILMAGILEIIANTQFFETKIPLKKHKKAQVQQQQPPVVPQQPPTQPMQMPSQDAPGVNFCPECGGKIDEGTEFCGGCGAKLNK